MVNPACQDSASAGHLLALKSMHSFVACSYSAIDRQLLTETIHIMCQ